MRTAQDLDFHHHFPFSIYPLTSKTQDSDPTVKLPTTSDEDFDRHQQVQPTL